LEDEREVIYKRLCKTVNYLSYESKIELKDEDNTVMNSGLLILSHAFRNPHQVPYLLLPQPHVSKENTIMELQITKHKIHHE